MLRHIAFVAEGTLGVSGGGPGAIVEAAELAGTLAAEAFALAPGLRALSLVAPGIDRLLAAPASAGAALRACAEATSTLARSAAGCGAALRICGRTEGLPGEMTAHAGAAAADRALLWFVRYGGREEIARAASRFLRAHPGATLGDDDLDGWLDTAGVPDPDLIVLAGGVFEAPDALVWQGSYAELWHTPAPWSAFTVEDLRRAIRDFATRQRRFGG